MSHGELRLMIGARGGGMFSVPGKHRVVGLLLFLLVLLTHIQRCQVDAQQLSDTLAAVDVAILVKDLEEASQVNLLYLHWRTSPKMALQRTFLLTNLSQ